MKNTIDDPQKFINEHLKPPQIYFALQSAWYSSRQSNFTLCSVLSQTFISTETQVYSDPSRHTTTAPMRHPRCNFGVTRWRNKSRLEEKVTLPKIYGIRCLHQDVPHAKRESEKWCTHNSSPEWKLTAKWNIVFWCGTVGVNFQLKLTLDIKI